MKDNIIAKMSNKKYLELVEETKPDGSQIGF
jgi:hypothetical protein